MATKTNFMSKRSCFFLLDYSSIETVRILVWVFQTGFTSENSEYKLLSISRKPAQSALTKWILNMKIWMGLSKRESFIKKKTHTHDAICYFCIIWLWTNYKLFANYLSFINGCLRKKKINHPESQIKVFLRLHHKLQPNFPQILLWDNRETKKGSPWYYQPIFTLHREHMASSNLLVGQIESSKTSSSDPDSSSSLSKLDSSSLDSSLSSSSSK